MAIMASSKPRKLIPPGNYFARAYMMIHIGTVKETYEGKESMVNKVRIGWEFPSERTDTETEGGESKPLVLSVEYTLSTAPNANMRKMIESWRGKPLTPQEASSYDIMDLLGKACLINIVHKEGKGDNAGKYFEKILGITPLTKGFSGFEPENKQIVFDYDDKFNLRLLESLPDFIKTKVKSSLEWNQKVKEGKVTLAATAPILNEENKKEFGSEGIDVGNKTIDDLPF